MKTTEPVDALVRILNQIEFATDGFTYPIDDFTDEELIYIPAADGTLISALPCLLQFVHPKEKSKLKNAIVYLTELGEKQGEAWARFYEKCEGEDEHLAQQIKALQSKINGSHNIANF